MMRVYADKSHYNEADRKALVDIVKAQWSAASLEERRQVYGKHVDLFEIVDAPDRADIHVLTMKWPFYVERGRVDLVQRAVDAARRAKRPIAVFSEGDSEANFPIAGDDIHVFQHAGYASRHRTKHHGMPAFFVDPLVGELALRDKGPRAVVGFCGQAGSSLPRHAARFLRNELRRVRWRLGRERWEPPPLEHTWFRQRVLEAFQSSRAVEAKFVLRAQYRAGVKSDDRNDPAQQARREFLDNVIGTDYTVCVRGGGNFSVRFYEALALGRIPAFVDTDCLLPYAKQIPWRDHVVWIEQHEVPRAGSILAAHHARLSASEFRERQLAGRALWSERLTPGGFYSHFREHFPELD